MDKNSFVEDSPRIKEIYVNPDCIGIIRLQTGTTLKPPLYSPWRIEIAVAFQYNLQFRKPLGNPSLLLYLSLYFKTHRQRYYELLNEVRLTGEWEAWLDFFADAVIHTATQAVATAQQLMLLSGEDGQRINGLKRISGSAHLIHKAMLERPMASPKWIQGKTKLSPATVNACLRELEQLGIVKEITGQKRNRLYSYAQYIRIMNEGTELPH